jgi:zinc D-Ala-D-Ala carboxypeptidase
LSQTIAYTSDNWPSARWPNFVIHEISCTHCEQTVLDPTAMDKLQRLRNDIGPISLTSAYRCPDHPVEQAKTKGPGSHSLGKAFDVPCRGELAFDILKAALSIGFTGIGIAQTGDHNRFLHLDCIDHLDQFHAPRPAIWSY